MHLIFLLCNIFQLVIQLHAECPPSVGETNWVHDDDLKKCYGQLVGQKRSFGQAERWCRDHDAHLAMPKTHVEWLAIVDSTSKAGTGVVWVGIDDIEYEKEYRWANRDVPHTEKLRWGTGQPKYNGERCVTMPTKGRVQQLRHSLCWKLFEFVCERPDWQVARKPHEKRCPPGWVYFDCGDYCYWAPNSTRTYVEAIGVCDGQNAQLAMPKSTRQQRAVMLAMKRFNKTTPDFEGLAAWIGLKDIASKIWEWADGSVLFMEKDYWNWSSTSVSTDTKKCIALDMKGLLGFYECLNKKYFVCAKRQTPSTTPTQAVCGKTEEMSKHKLAAYSRSDEKYGEMRLSPKYTRRRLSKQHSYRNRDERIVRRTIGSQFRKLNIGYISNAKNINIEDFPWVARIELTFRDDMSAMCGGALISPQHVVTAAHCTHQLEEYEYSPLLNSDISVGLGSVSMLMKDGSVEEVHMYKVHNAFEPHAQINYQHDIAIIELERDIQLDCPHVRPLCLPEKKYASLHGLRCFHVGGGVGSGGWLKYCDINSNNIVTFEDFNIMVQTKSCLMEAGDSGSPLVCIDDADADPLWTLMGVSNGVTNDFQVFTRVDSHLQWINTIKGTGQRGKVGHQLLCDEAFSYISCEHGRPPAIKVEKAFYGRRSLNKCRTDSVPMKTGCHSDVTEFIAQNCNQKNFCTIVVNTERLGDPCPGFSKYLEFTYKCVSFDTIHMNLHQVQCHKDLHLIISCGVENSYSIEVNYATFGKQSASVCTVYADNPQDSCTFIDITEDVAERCNKKQHCLILFPTHNFGAPCNKEQKYVEAYFSCLPEYHKRFQLCSSEGQLNITCREFDHHHIEVTTATYGMGTSFKCFGESFEPDCTTSDITDKVAASCSGNVTCQTRLSYKIFGDPYPTKKKFFEVFYKCEPDNIVVLCHGEKQIKLECSQTKPHNIRVTSAIYGQTLTDVCGTPSEDRKCGGKDVTSILAEKCNNKMTCTDNNDVNIWGKPCEVHTEILVVYYTCIPERVAHVCYDKGELSLKCYPKKLSINLAVYGKGSPGPCDVSGDQVNKGCRGTPVTEAIAIRCNNLKSNSCTARIDFTQWEDPCPDFPKYLEVFYTCV